MVYFRKNDIFRWKTPGIMEIELPIRVVLVDDQQMWLEALSILLSQLQGPTRRRNIHKTAHFLAMLQGDGDMPIAMPLRALRERPTSAEGVGPEQFASGHPVEMNFFQIWIDDFKKQLVVLFTKDGKIKPMGFVLQSEKKALLGNRLEIRIIERQYCFQVRCVFQYLEISCLAIEHQVLEVTINDDRRELRAGSASRRYGEKPDDHNPWRPPMHNRTFTVQREEAR
jgi:hypothetical protein